METQKTQVSKRPKKTPTPPKEQKGGKNIGLVIALVGIILILSGVIGYLFMQKSSDDKIISEKNEVIEDKSESIDSLGLALEEEIDKLRILQSQYVELGEEKESIESQIAELEESLTIWKNKASYSSSQKSKIQKKLEQALKDSEERQLVMRQEVDSLSLLNKDLQFAADSLIATTTDQQTVITDLSKKAARLRAENANVVVRNSKGKVVTKTPYKNKYVETIQVLFNIAVNDDAPLGKREVTIRIQKPEGGILYNSSSGGGTFTDENEKELFYTAAKSIDFTNTYQEVSLPYTKESDLGSGIYKVELHADGELLGNTAFEVK